MNKTLTIQYQEFADYSELGSEMEAQVAQAYEAASKAYAPYSQFKVGALLQLEGGKLIRGNNQENIAYPSGLCAERVALFHAGADHPGAVMEQLVIVSQGELIDADACLSPCGACRQVIAEYEIKQQKPIRIVLVSPSRRTFVFDSIADLLIFPFGLK